MGLKTFNIGERQALEFLCDCSTHSKGLGKAWFDAGTFEVNFTLALLTGWTKDRDDHDAWLCPQCANEPKTESDSRTQRTAQSSPRLR
jgi:hypothetical protein